MYAKVYASLWEGSMRGKPDDQLVFIFLLSKAGAAGVTDVTFEVITQATGLPISRVRRAIERLTSEDPESRSELQNGRRIVPIDDHREWGWVIVNYQKYREFQDSQRVRELAAERARNYRAKKKERHASSRVTNVMRDASRPSRQAEDKDTTEGEDEEEAPLRSSSRF